jgi:ABC-2 type transport system permease protein
MILFLHQWKSELLKLFARRRTYIGFVAFLALELVIWLLFEFLNGAKRLAGLISRQGQAFEKYDSALTIAFIIIGLSVLLLGAIYLALVAGDIVAKENEDGHYRLLLVRPISRVRLLFIKYLSCTGYTFLLMQFIVWTSFLLGLILKGWGGGFFVGNIYPPMIEFYPWGEGLERFFVSTLLMSFSMTLISSIAFFFSCLPMKPAAATIGALSYFLIDWIMRESGFMGNYDQFLLTKHISSWALALKATIPWPVILRSFTVIAAVNASLFIFGAAVFESRDLKS